jgi:predicted cation transporter
MLPRARALCDADSLAAARVAHHLQHVHIASFIIVLLVQGTITRNRHDLQKAGSVEPLHIICIERRR